MLRRNGLTEVPVSHGKADVVTTVKCRPTKAELLSVALCSANDLNG
jgi:hypothetical protein